MPQALGDLWRHSLRGGELKLLEATANKTSYMLFACFTMQMQQKGMIMQSVLVMN